MRHIIRTKIALVYILLLCFGCKSELNEKPEMVLSRDLMVKIIVDVQLLEAAHKSINLNAKQQKPIRDTTYAIIYNKHNTTAAEFDSCLRTYTQYPELFSEIMEEAENRLNNTK